MSRSVSAASLALALAAATAFAGPAAARERVRIVGSALVTGFAAVVAEAVSEPDGAADVSAGSQDAAFKAFCAGVGVSTPDAVVSLRPMTDAETKACTGAGVTAIVDLPIGRDALVLVRHPAGPALTLTRGELFTALAAKVLVDGQLVANSYERWSEIDPALPDAPIRVIGPPPGSDLAAAFASLIVEPGCRSFAALQELPPEAGDICTALRKDGAFAAATGDLDAALAAVTAEPGTIAVTSFARAASANGAVVPIAVDGVMPDTATIASGRYGATLDLHLTVKNAHRALVPAFDRFVRVIASEDWIGPDGSLVRRGLVPSPSDVRGRLRRDLDAGKPPTAG